MQYFPHADDTKQCNKQHIEQSLFFSFRSNLCVCFFLPLTHIFPDLPNKLVQRGSKDNGDTQHLFLVELVIVVHYAQGYGKYFSGCNDEGDHMLSEQFY